MSEPTMSVARSLESQLAGAVDEFMAEIHRGHHPSIDDFATRYSEIADELRRVLPALAMLGSSEPHAQLAGPDTEDGTLGDFRLIREVGRGGMGIVYEAEQISLCRKVALKVLPFAATMDPRQLQRFRNEAQAAACLHHPNIVPVHGVGVDRGVHYYAMQLIEGQTLAEVIKNLTPQPPSRFGKGEDDLLPSPPASGGEGLGVRGVASTSPIAALSTKRDRAHFRHIAALIASAADALEYAHSMGVLHRDIKPGNLMLDNSPSPLAGEGKGGGYAGHLWITDFGLAKVVASLRDAEAGCGATRLLPDLTLTGDMIGTLRYMSPEAALAKHGLVDHRTDIYSLGATLYELLTLQPAVDGADKAEMLKRIAWDDPTPLRKHDKSIPAELETITLKCLAKEPSERYASAGELAADLRRWADDKPIMAKPPGLLDRVGKWAGGHRAGIAVAAAILVLATAGLATSVALLAKKESETAQANANAQKRLDQLDKANDLLGAVFAKLDLAAEEKGGPALREQLKAQLRRAVQELDAEAIGDRLTVAKLQDRLAKSLLSLGEPDEAAVLLAKTVATRRSLLGSEHADTLKTLANLATAFRDTGRNAESIQLCEFVRDARLANLGAEHPDTLTALSELALSYENAGRVSEAIQLCEQVRSARIAKLGANHPDTLTTLNNLAAAYHRAGKLSQAIRIHEQVRDVEVDKFGPDHPQTLTTLNNLATDYRAIGNLPEATRLLEQVRDARMASVGADHPATLTALSNLAGAYEDAGRLTEAIQIFERVQSAFVAKFGPDHPSTLIVFNNLAKAYEASGKLREAIRLYEKARDVQVAKLGVEHPDTLTTLNNLGSAYRAAGKVAEAIRIHEQARDILMAKFEPDHPFTLGTLNNLAFAYERAGRLPEAIQILEQIHKVRIAKFGADHPDTLVVANNLLVCYQHAGRLADAIHIGEQVRDLKVAKLGPEHPETLTTFNNLAAAYAKSGRLRDAAPLFEAAARGIERRRFQHQYAASTLNGTVRCYEQLREFDKAENWSRKWLAAVKQKSGSDSLEFASALVGLGSTLLIAEKFADAETILRECLAIREGKEPDAWSTFNTRFLLGGALARQKRFAEAEPLLVAGFDGMQKRAATIPPPSKRWIAESIEQIVALYDHMDQRGQADEWRKRLANWQETMPSDKSSK